MSVLEPVPGYAEVLEGLKREISAARIQAVRAVNSEIVELYWRIGIEIGSRQEQHGWGAKVNERLADDLQAAFPEMRGLSRSNLAFMRAFATTWPALDDVRTVLGRLPWGHNIDLLAGKLGNRETRLYYAQKAIEHGWTRKILSVQIASDLHLREGKALTNFDGRLEPDDAVAAQLITRDPYTFEFVNLTEDSRESDLEKALLAELRRFMLELGAGFAFVASQHHLEVDGEDFYIDLLFFHIPTNRYVVIDLKLGKFRPADAGQINFYVNVVNDQLRQEHHQPTLGLILCATRSEPVVRFALDGIEGPVGVAAWQLEAPSSELPVAELQEGLERIIERHADEIDAIDENASADESEPA